MNKKSASYLAITCGVLVSAFALYSFQSANIEKSDVIVTKVSQDTSKPIEQTPVKHEISNHQEFNKLVEGSNITFRFNKNDEGWVNPSIFNTSNVHAQDVDIKMTSSGILQFHVYEQKQDNWLIGAKVTLDKIAVNGGDVAYKDAVELPFSLQLGKQGELKNFVFPENISEHAKVLLTQISSQFQIMIPENHRAHWQTKEKDEIGSAVFSYQREDIANNWKIKKEKDRYFRMKKNDLIDAQAEVLDSLSTSFVGKDNSWVQSIQSNETRQLFTGGQHVSHIDGTFQATREDSYNGYQFPNSYKTFLSSISQAGTKSIADIKGKEDMFGISTKIPLANALNIFQQSFEENINFSELFITNYLRQNPDAGFELVKVLNKSTDALPQDQELLLWYALAKAGTAENQRALLHAAQDSTALASTRTRSLAAIHEVETPTSSLVSGLWGLSSDTDADVAHMSVLTLGSMAQSNRLSDDSNPNNIIDQMGQRLNSEDTSKDDNLLLLSALSNSSNQHALPVLRPQLNHEDGDIRARTLASLSNIEGDQGVEDVINHMETEQSPSVRLEALKSMRNQISNEDVNQWFQEELQSELSNADYDAAQVDTMVEALGTSLDTHPGNETFLRNLSNRDIPEDTRVKIYHYVSPTAIDLS